MADPIFIVIGGEILTEHDFMMSLLPDRGLYGRRKIYCDYSEITRDNILDTLSKANAVHTLNRCEIQYLYDYYRGKQDIRNKKKVVRPEINNIVTVNRANEIVAFKVSYLLGEPLQYISRNGNDSTSSQINTLNEFMYSEDKATKDKEVADWMHICGVGCRMVLPDPENEREGSPFVIYTLDPRDAYVIYSSKIGHKPLAGVIWQTDENGEFYYTVYVKNKQFEIKGDEIKETPHVLNCIPMVEYVYNEARMGSFEIVLPLLDAINTLESNRVDGVEDFVNSFDVFQNCEISGDEYSELSAGGKAIMIKTSVPGMESKVYRIASELGQTGVQTAIDDAYDSVLTICGMPNRNGGSSTSDTGAATIMRDGWSAAESRAKDSEALWCRSEREFLRVVLQICESEPSLSLGLANIGLKFTRRNYADIQSKAQVLAEMLNNSKIHPKLAFQSCGLFTDAEEAYSMSMEWYDKNSQKFADQLNQNNQNGENGQGNQNNQDEKKDQEENEDDKSDRKIGF